MMPELEHSQKRCHLWAASHFISMSGAQGRKPHPKSKFSPEEDIVLNRLVFQFGQSDWNLIARFMPDRNPRQCRERWMKYLSPTNRFEPFRPEEDELLRRLYRQFGAKWVKISRFFQRRTDIQVKNRWLVLMRKDNKQGQVEKASSPVMSLPEPESPPVANLCTVNDIDLNPVQFDIDLWSQIDIPTWHMDEVGWGI